MSNLPRQLDIPLKLPIIDGDLSVSETVRKLDPLLAEWHVPIYERPQMIVTKMLWELDQRDADFEEQVRECYYDLYPNTASPGSQRLTGALSVRGTIFSVRVPTVVLTEEDGRRVIHMFAKEILSHEDPITWVEQAPNWARLDSDNLAAVKTDLVHICKMLRSIHASLRLTLSDDGDVDRLKIKIVPSLEQAARYLLEPYPAAIQYAYWELQMALEHVLKSREQQILGSFTKGHALHVLYRKMGGTDQARFKDLMRFIPEWKEAANLRYGVGNRENRQECYRAYMKTLEFVAWAVTTLKKWWPLP